MQRIQRNQKVKVISALVFCLGIPVPAFAQTNVVQNPNFSQGTVPFGTPVSLTVAYGVGPSAATSWGLLNNYAGTTTSSLLSSAAPPGPEPFLGGSSEMLHVVTTTSGNGIYTIGNMPNTNNASAWVYVTSGEATLFDVQDGVIGGINGNYGGYATDNTLGHWVQLNPAVGQGSASHEIAIEAGDWDGNGGAANFYVGLVQANAAVPEANTLIILALGGTMGVWGLGSRRFNRSSA
jgi:hypothetical protein